MSTRSRIAMVNLDGSVKSIYCHWDGYLEWNGDILANCYVTNEEVNSLINLGDISSLGRLLEDTESYHFTRGEELVIKYHPNLDSFFNYVGYCGEEYAYIFQDDVWYYSDYKMFEEKRRELLIPKLIELGVMEKDGE